MNATSGGVRQFRIRRTYTVRQDLERAGIKVDVASSRTGVCSARSGQSVQARFAINSMNVNDYGAIVFGGV